MREFLHIKVDTREFDQALRNLAKETSKSLPDLINDQAYRLANEALQQTRRADPAKIEGQLSQEHLTSQIGSKSKSGKVRFYKKAKKVKSPIENSLAARIIQKRRWEAGKMRLYGKDMEVAVRRMIGARKRACAFGASGWIPAIKLFGRAAKNKSFMAKEGGRRGGAKQVGTDKGGAHIARGDVWMKVASLWNSATQNQTRSSGRPGRLEDVVRQALERAIPIRVRDMKSHYQDQLNKVWRKFGSKFAGF